MEQIFKPDTITKSACRWLLEGAIPGTYSGPDPGISHSLAPLLSRETGRKEISLSCTAMWFRQEQITRTVLQEIAKRGITVWAVKGFDLARSIYPFPGGRPMCDADLFIEGKDRSIIMDIFHKCGWSKGSPGDGVFTSGVVSEMKMFKHNVMVELHTHIFYFPATFPGKLPVDLFENGRFLEPGLMGFAWHNALLLVIIHLLTNVSIRPVWWVDVCILCRKVTEAGTWGQFRKNAFSTKLGSAIALPLKTAVSQLNAEVPSDVILSLQNCHSGHEGILGKLRMGKKVPTMLNLRYLNGWQKISWGYALFWLILSGKNPLKKE